MPSHWDRAYGKQGKQQPPRRPPPQQGLGQGGQYAGYGFSPPGAQCPPSSPEEALADCIRAMQQLLEQSLQMSELAPWIHPPFRGRSLCDRERVILSTTAGLNAGVNAAGVALQAALTIPGTPTAYVPPLLEMDELNDYQRILFYESPASSATRISSWGVSVSNLSVEGVIFRVLAGSVAGGPPSAPDPVLSSVDVQSHESVFMLLQPGQTIEVQAILRDVTNSPAVIDFGFCGWSWPVRSREDSPKGMIMRTGYGLDCR